MKAYRFRLKSVARVREIQERVARERFMISVRDLRRSEERERRAEEDLVRFDPPSGVVPMGELLWASDQAERLAASVELTRNIRIAAVESCNTSRESWNVAVKRSDVLRRLEEYGFDQWRSEAAREAGAELDDWANARHGLIGADR